MDEVYAKRVRDAAIAGWWTILVAVIVASVQWLAYLLCVWGPSMSWERMGRLWMGYMAVFKIIIWTMILAVIWLSLWARRLRRA
jgi:uncharacterized membrane protein YhaH (DUF805 family)